MTFTSSWRSPSNIALIKYWGKHHLQLPCNPSLSFTLAACHTEMRMTITPEVSVPGIHVLYEGQHKPSFEPKITRFFSLVSDRFPWLSKVAVEIDSKNTFPHGAGIASSASAMSALALCLMDINDQISGLSGQKDENWWRSTSEIARLGSGSACRSVYPVSALWGEMSQISDSNDAYAIPWEKNLAPVFKDYQDTILIVSTSEKSVSSTAGHALMDTLAYAETRYAEAKRNIIRLCDVMSHPNDLNSFISIVESEALQLHALMMAGNKPFILLEPGTVSIIKEVWRFRKETGLPVCFTLDAGPNVHLLYPSIHAAAIMDWVRNDLVQHCADGMYIEDHVGAGPIKINAD
jgi:diphosphomevalonate decarboxylase